MVRPFLYSFFALCPGQGAKPFPKGRVYKTQLCPPVHPLLSFLQQFFRSSRPANSARWRPVALTPAQERQHREWVAQQVFLNWLGPYFKAYHLAKGGAGGRRGLRVEPLREAGRQGALFFYDTSIGPGNFRHLFEHLGERILDLGYHRACADGRTQRHQHHTETALKQFFKPNPTDCPQSGCCNQRFGLLTVDLVSMNKEPLFIRLASNAIQSPEFTPPCSFDALLQAVFDQPPASSEVKARVAAFTNF